MNAMHLIGYAFASVKVEYNMMHRLLADNELILFLQFAGPRRKQPNVSVRYDNFAEANLLELNIRQDYANNLYDVGGGTDVVIRTQQLTLSSGQ